MTLQDGEEISSRRRREKMYIELPNGRRRMPSGEECNLSRSSSKAGGIYSSIDSAVSHKENASTSNNDEVKQVKLNSFACSEISFCSFQTMHLFLSMSVLC